jgi:thiosulfate reductase cytochrome b subunit
MSLQKSYVYSGFERFCHWTQTTLILSLALTGFEIHGSFQMLGYRQAVALHNSASMALLILIVFGLFWRATTGEWRQYVPTRRFVRAQMEYYLHGIFQGAPHPTKKTVLSKMNPLQRLVYLGLKGLLIPVMILSGLLYMFYRLPQGSESGMLGATNLAVVALVHTAGAFILVAFVIGHIYLTTTGRTMFSNLKAMLTGYEELEVEDGVVADPKPADGEAIGGEA